MQTTDHFSLVLINKQVVTGMSVAVFIGECIQSNQVYNYFISPTHGATNPP